MDGFGLFAMPIYTNFRLFLFFFEILIAIYFSIVDHQNSRNGFPIQLKHFSPDWNFQKKCACTRWRWISRLLKCSNATEPLFTMIIWLNKFNPESERDQCCRCFIILITRWSIYLFALFCFERRISQRELWTIIERRLLEAKGTNTQRLALFKHEIVFKWKYLKRSNAQMHNAHIRIA